MDWEDPSNLQLTPQLRRLARRGGIKRISGTIYDEVRRAMVDRLKTVSAPDTTSSWAMASRTKMVQVIKDCCCFLDLTQRKSKQYFHYFKSTNVERKQASVRD